MLASSLFSMNSEVNLLLFFDSSRCKINLLFEIFLFVCLFIMCKCGCTHGMQMEDSGQFSGVLVSSYLIVAISLLFLFALCIHVLAAGFFRGKDGSDSL